MSGIRRGDRFVAYPNRRPAERLFIEVTRVARDGTWADITVETWAVMWTKRQKLDSRGFPPESRPYAWVERDLNAQELDHMDKLREEGILA